MKVLITGGCGFIGAHLTKQLLERGDEITVLDDFSTGVFRVKDPRVEIVEGDVADSKLVDKLIKETDLVFHLAAVVGVAPVAISQSRTWFTNVSGSEVVFLRSMLHKKPVIFTSSSEIYGETGGILTETTPSYFPQFSTNPRAVYGISKLAAEHLALSLVKEHKANIKIARLFNTTGPGQLPNYGMVVPKFIHNAIRDEDLEVYGEPDAERTFIDVRDCVKILVRLSEQPPGTLTNICGGHITTITQLAHEINERVGGKGRVIHQDMPYGDDIKDIKRGYPSYENMAKLFGIMTKLSGTLRFTPWLTTIDDSILWMRTNIEQINPQAT